MRAITTLCFVLLTWSMQSQHALTVMSFNIRYPNPGDGLHTWDKRRPLVKSLVSYHDPDIIGVQEAYRRQLEDWVKDMPQYAWYGVSRTDGSAHPDPDAEFSAIIYKRSRFEWLDGNTFWLSEDASAKGSTGWDAALPRIVTWSKFRDRDSGKDFFHFNTHFDHIGVIARKESARLLLLKVDLIAGGAPVIVTGDLNCSDVDDPYKILTDRSSSVHLDDAFTLSATPHHGPVASFAGSFTLEGLNDHRIDYIMVKNGWKVMKHAILSDSWHGQLASDHLPVLAVLSSMP